MTSRYTNLHYFSSLLLPVWRIISSRQGDVSSYRLFRSRDSPKTLIFCPTEIRRFSFPFVPFLSMSQSWLEKALPREIASSPPSTMLPPVRGMSTNNNNNNGTRCLRDSNNLRTCNEYLWKRNASLSLSLPLLKIHAIRSYLGGRYCDR